MKVVLYLFCWQFGLSLVIASNAAIARRCNDASA